MPPAGWNNMGTNTCDPNNGAAGLCESYNEDPASPGTQDSLWCFYHTVNNDSANYAFNALNTGATIACPVGVGQCYPSTWMGSLMVYSGVNPATPVENHSTNFLTPTQTASNGNALVAQGFTTANNNDMLVSPFFDIANPNNVGNPSGYTQVWSSPFFDCCSSAGSNKLQAAEGSTGNPAAAITSGDYGYAELIALTAGTVSATPTPTSSATPTATATLTPTPTATGQGSPSPTPTAAPTVKGTPTPTNTGSPSPTSTATPNGLDQYGGLTAVQCPNGPSAHFYTEQLGDRWWLCDPAGNAFIMKGVAYDMMNVDSEQYALDQTKYITGPTSNWELNWSIEQANRLLSWGFNTVADDSYGGMTPGYLDPQWGTTDNTIPAAQRMPYTFINDTTRYIFENTAGCAAPSPIKDLMNGNGAAYTGYRYDYGDYFDPNFNPCVAGIVQYSGINAIATGIHNDYLLYITIDEGDQTGGLISSAGPNFPSLPSVSSSGNPSWVTLTTAPTQTSNSSWGATYGDCKVYTKLQMVNNLVAEYGTIAALNAAWGSSYTTFWSSQPGYTTSNDWASGDSNCSEYTGWGNGTGLLDENGASSWVGNLYTLAGETATMQADMSAFYTAYLDQYLSVMRSQWHNSSYGAPGVLLQMQFGGWSTPPRQEALTEGAKYIDLPQLSPIPPAPWACPTGGCTDSQQRVDFVAEYLGNHPWINWQGIDANPDSAESAYPSSIGSPYTTQEERGAGYQSMMEEQLNSKDTATGTYHVVGFYWWDAFDMDSQELNWGLITPLDNPYDGKSATIAGDGLDQWGYPSGGEKANYGDFTDDVTAANAGFYANMAP
jgi:hypothetical protein